MISCEEVRRHEMRYVYERCWLKDGTSRWFEAILATFLEEKVISGESNRDLRNQIVSKIVDTVDRADRDFEKRIFPLIMNLFMAKIKKMRS